MNVCLNRCIYCHKSVLNSGNSVTFLLPDTSSHVNMTAFFEKGIYYKSKSEYKRITYVGFLTLIVIIGLALFYYVKIEIVKFGCSSLF